MPLDRRRFLKVAASTLVGSLSIAGAYPFLEAKWCRVTRSTIELHHLPASFRGLTIALISDVHHGPFVPLAYVRHVVDLTNSLKPDLVLLAGDYVSQHLRFIGPSIEALSPLRGYWGALQYSVTTTTGKVHRRHVKHLRTRELNS